MKKFALIPVIISVLILCGVILYYTVVVIEAREYTRTVVADVLSDTDNAVSLDDLSDERLSMLLAVEDPAFFSHTGVDLKTPGAGLTTITQSLVKIFYFDAFTPGVKKIRQTLIARFALDPLVSKEDQLVLFINYIGLGKNTRGFREASEYYFNKTFTDLTDDEYLALVAMIIAPGTFNVADHPERNALRVSRIKAVIEGDYTPKGLCDLYYGPMEEDIIDQLPPMSYFEKYYE
ncbi:MAG: transglycosylase domain-containing protein [Deltaproteobacteria bacterium]|nr:transglycosylase domain-containing protein [Candidatus Zymogenaceae bacterium]